MQNKENLQQKGADGECEEKKNTTLCQQHIRWQNKKLNQKRICWRFSAFVAAAFCVRRERKSETANKFLNLSNVTVNGRRSANGMAEIIENLLTT